MALGTALQGFRDRREPESSLFPVLWAPRGEAGGVDTAPLQVLLRADCPWSTLDVQDKQTSHSEPSGWPALTLGLRSPSRLFLYRLSNPLLSWEFPAGEASFESSTYFVFLQ